MNQGLELIENPAEKRQLSKLIGILTLENQSTRSVFTEDCIIILNFLCTQGEISLENARL
jgi:GAF domain-containing protein